MPNKPAHIPPVHIFWFSCLSSSEAALMPRTAETAPFYQTEPGGFSLKLCRIIWFGSDRPEGFRFLKTEKSPFVAAYKLLTSFTENSLIFLNISSGIKSVFGVMRDFNVTKCRQPRDWSSIQTVFVVQAVIHTTEISENNSTKNLWNFEINLKIFYKNMEK